MMMKYGDSPMAAQTPGGIQGSGHARAAGGGRQAADGFRRAAADVRSDEGHFGHSRRR